jgi:hypothetical protein
MTDGRLTDRGIRLTLALTLAEFGANFSFRH